MNSSKMLGSLRSEVRVELFSQEALELCQPPRRTDKHQPPGLRLFFKRCNRVYSAAKGGSRTAAIRLEKLEDEIEKIAEKFMELEKNLTHYEFCKVREGIGRIELPLVPTPDVGFQALYLLVRFDKLCVRAESYLPTGQAQQLIRSGKRQLRRLFSYQF